MGQELHQAQKGNGNGKGQHGGNEGIYEALLRWNSRTAWAIDPASSSFK
jgi:hypothetical protein